MYKLTQTILRSIHIKCPRFIKWHATALTPDHIFQYTKLVYNNSDPLFCSIGVGSKVLHNPGS